jgi:hypothetical protein
MAMDVAEGPFSADVLAVHLHGLAPWQWAAHSKQA